MGACKHPALEQAFSESLTSHVFDIPSIFRCQFGLGCFFYSKSLLEKP